MPVLSDTFLQPLCEAHLIPQRLFDCLKSLHDKTHVCLLSPKTPLFMPGVSFCLSKADFTLNVTLSEKHSSTILSISYLCLPARSVSFNISTSLFGGFYFPFLNGLKKKEPLKWYQNLSSKCETRTVCRLDRWLFKVPSQEQETRVNMEHLGISHNTVAFFIHRHAGRLHPHHFNSSRNSLKSSITFTWASPFALLVKKNYKGTF